MIIPKFIRKKCEEYIRRTDQREYRKELRKYSREERDLIRNGRKTPLISISHLVETVGKDKIRYLTDSGTIYEDTRTDRPVGEVWKHEPVACETYSLGSRWWKETVKDWLKIGKLDADYLIEPMTRPQHLGDFCTTHLLMAIPIRLLGKKETLENKLKIGESKVN